MTDAELARDNIAEAFLTFASAAPKARIARSEHYWQSTSSFKHPLANFAIRLNLQDHHIDDLVEKARAHSFFRVHVITGDSPPTLLGLFESKGLTEASHMKLMISRAAGLADPRVQELPPQDARQVAEFTVEQFFWTAQAQIRQRVTELAYAMARDPRQTTYAIYGESGIQAAASVFYTDAVAGLYNVCVHPSSRGRGLGSAIVQHACHQAAFRREKIVLQCGESLVGWYQVLGFREAGESFVLCSP